MRTRNVDVDEHIQKLGTETLQIVNNGYALAAIMTDIITTPLFKMREVDGAVQTDAQGLPQMELDAQNYPIANTELIDQRLGEGHQAAQKLV